MSALTFKLAEPPKQRVDCSALTPDKLAGKTRADIGALPLQSGNRKLRVGELFSLSGDDASEIVIENSSDKLDRIGAGMQDGVITVRGDVGACLGLAMKSGTIAVHGNCGILAAAELAGGMVDIGGSCGDFVGGALAGNRRGMAGGIVIVRGNAGARAGDHMRRGALLIEGNCGDFCGARMVAGTIAVLGTVGDGAGFAMQRGTLLLSSLPKNMLATFNDCGSHNLGFLPLLVQSWRRLPGRFAQLEIRQRVRRYMGDLATSGKGEILVWE
ncbi:MAG: formylmethanofuran dehydrogenase subunit C [Burkholderiales bacterium]